MDTRRQLYQTPDKVRIVNPYRYQPSGSSLTTNLEEWWEDADKTGKHASIVLSGTVNTITNPIGTGLDGFQYNTSGLTGAIPALDSYAGWTIAVVGRYMPVYVARVGGYNERLNANSAARARDNDGTATTTTSKGFLSSGTYCAVAAVVNATGVTHYRNADGATTATFASAHDNAYALGTSFDVIEAANAEACIIAVWSRAITSGEFDEFYNSGSYLKYADL